MRVACLVNNWLGWQCLKAIQANGDEVVALVIHPSASRKFGTEILQSAALDPRHVFDARSLRDEAALASLKLCGAEMAVSLLFGHILRPSCIDLFPRGVINLHPSYLPYNRGQYPNVWSIVEGTPAGVTLHYIDEGLDTGDIVAQREVTVSATDTGASLYGKLEQAGLQLFCDEWPNIASGNASRWHQTGNATSHRTKDVDTIDRIDLDRLYSARQLIDILRARTYPPHRGAYFEVDGRRVYLRLELAEEVVASDTAKSQDAA
jgi:methionyl-tRNA formyltransferase